MNKIVKSSYYTLMTFLVILITVLLLSGCRSDPESGFEAPDFMYFPEILSFPMPEGVEWIENLTVSGDSAFYIGDDSSIYVFDSEGRSLFTLDVQWVEKFINLQDGSVTHPGWGGNGRVLSKIDVAGKKFGDTVDLPSNANNVYRGNEEFQLIFTDNIGLYGIEKESEDVVLLLRWIDSDITLEGLQGVAFLTDGQIMVNSQMWNNEGTQHELIFLSKTPYSEISDRTILSLATFYLDWNIRSAVVQFNRSSTTHRIQVNDYSEFNTDDDWQAGLTRLSAEIIAGNVPDILDVSNLPFDRYAAKDLLMDLYPLIDSDPDFGRSDFIENVLKTTEINGMLYRIFPNFSISTLLGNPLVVGSGSGWNMEEFLAVIEANPNADFPLGQGLTKLHFLQAFFMFNMNDYVDWNAGTVNFDNRDFIDLLMFANTLPDEYDWDDYIPENELIAEGRQIMAAIGLSDFDDYQMYRAIFGGDVVFKGFPNESKNGYSIITNTGFAITTRCKDADGAWSFLRTFLNEDWQSNNIWYGLPLNKSVFDKKLKDAMNEDEYGRRSVGWNNFFIELEPLTREDADQIMALINSVSGSIGQDDALWNIVSESANDFFNGQTSASDAARVIQNRASIYVSEQG